MELRVTGASGALAQRPAFSFHLFHGFWPLIALLSVALSGCGGEPPQQAASAPARQSRSRGRPSRRTVPPNFDGVTGELEAVEEDQVHARVGGSVTNVEFRDSAS